MLNEITIHGYLGRDPELTEQQGQSGPYKRVSFSVGVSRDFGDGTDWFRCSMTGKRAEVIEKYFHKGSEIIVTGRMESYKPKTDPDKTAWILKVTGFDFAGKGGSNKQSEKDAPAEDFEELTEEVPF